MNNVEVWKRRPKHPEHQQLPMWEIQVAVGNDPRKHAEVLAAHKVRIAEIIGRPVGSTDNPRTHIAATRETCEKLRKEGLIVNYSAPREKGEPPKQTNAATKPYVDPLDQLFKDILG